MSDTGHQGASAGMNDEVLALRLHQEFSTQKEASRFVRDFALSQGKRAVVDGKTSGGNNLRLKCSSETPCSFFVRLAKSKAQGVSCLRVTSFNAKHDGCSGRAKPTCEQVISFSVTTAAVSAQPTIAASALAAQVKTAEGVSVSARMLYRARDAVFGEVQGNVLDGFASLESLLAAYSTKNSGAHTDIQFDNQGRFVRGFVSHPYVAAHIDAGQQVYGIDGTHAKHGQYPSVMLVLVGRDGNNNNVVMGVAVCDGETAVNVDWFLSCCERARLNFDDLPVFTDRGKALLSALANRPEIVVRYCTRHIIGNAIKFLQSKGMGKFVPADIENAIYALQGSESEDEYTSRLKAIEASRAELAEYLGQIDPNKWILYTALGKTKLYGWRTTNFVESENGAAIPARHMHPFGIFNHYMEKFMAKSVESEANARKWKDEGTQVTEYAKQVLDEQSVEVGFHRIYIRPTTSRCSHTSGLTHFENLWNLYRVLKSVHHILNRDVY